MNTELTKITHKVYECMVDFSNAHGYPPTTREIAKILNMSSPSTAFYHIKKLEQIGVLKREQTKIRAIELRTVRDRTRVIDVPVVGNVAAGIPIFAVENTASTISITEGFFHASTLFFLKVKGDSMMDAGILDGDIIAVNKQPDANNGEIVVALIDDETTVKRYYKERECIVLKPENPKYHSMVFRKEIAILGKVVGLLRNRID